MLPKHPLKLQCPAERPVALVKQERVKMLPTNISSSIPTAGQCDHQPTSDLMFMCELVMYFQVPQSKKSVCSGAIPLNYMNSENCFRVQTTHLGHQGISK